MGSADADVVESAVDAQASLTPVLSAVNRAERAAVAKATG